MSDNTRIKLRTFEIALSALMAVVGALSSWNLTKTLSNSDSIIAIEANRFTAADGQAVWKEISRIREVVAQLPKEVPPEWFRRQVERNQAALDNMSARLGAIEAALAKLASGK